MIEYAIYSNTGEKEMNEDSIKVATNKRLSTYGFVLADGLGGHGNGDIASKFVVECAVAAVENTDSVSGIFIDECFATAQEMLMEEKEQKGYQSIKTTMVLLLISEDIARWGHIGDSRLYVFRSGKLLHRTLDHSVPQMLVESGQIKEKEIRHHADRSVLLRAMGAEWDSPSYEIDERHFKLHKGDTFILCSDGFWEWIDEKSMLKILKKDLSAYETLNEMASEVKLSGRGQNLDNLSAILINVK
jgi:serine/threonine protein phosphatase PrpC